MIINLVFILCFVNYALSNLHAFSKEYITEINEKQLTWRAGQNFHLNEWDVFKTLASGVVRDFNHQKDLKTNIHDLSQAVPKVFDAREAWPVCRSMIGLIRDQSNCEAGWAFAPVEAMSDRICIHSGYGKEVFVSAEDVLTCGSSMGCSAYDPYFAWRRWSGNGIVSGGLYNHTEQGCKSYFLPPCDGHSNNCSIREVPKCTDTCDSLALDFTSELTFGKCADLCQFTEEKQIQLEIYNNGPVTATFDVYEDFANYKSGVYQKTSPASLVGSHAVKIIGWATENGTNYWNVVNSWGEKWGDEGFFKILRGSNECGIESYVLSGMPDLSKF